MKKWKNAEKTQPEESERGEKLGKVGKNPARGKQAGRKTRKSRKKPNQRKASGVKNRKNAKKTQPEESKRGEKQGKVEKNPTRGKQAG